MKTKRLSAGKYLIENDGCFFLVQETGVSEGVSDKPVWSCYPSTSDGKITDHAFDGGSTLAEAKGYCVPPTRN